MKINNTIRFLFSIIICQLAGIIGSIFTAPSVQTWYAALQKPSFTPPDWIFAPAWIFLYLLMGISLYIVWKEGLKKKIVKTGVSIFAVQLILNSAWSFLFFGIRNPFLAFIEIIMLWTAIFLTMLVFFRIKKEAFYLLLPYLLWISFALVLNFSIWRLNL